MKSISISIFTAVILISLCFYGCKKNLVEKPYSSLPSSAVFSSETGLKQATLGIYETYDNGGSYGGAFTNVWRFMLADQGQMYSAQGQFGSVAPEIDQFAI